MPLVIDFLIDTPYDACDLRKGLAGEQPHNLKDLIAKEVSGGGCMTNVISDGVVLNSSFFPISDIAASYCTYLNRILS